MSNITSSNITLSVAPLSPIYNELLLSHYNFSTLLTAYDLSLPQEERNSKYLVISTLLNFSHHPDFLKPSKNKLDLFNTVDLSKLPIPSHFFAYLARNLNSILDDWLLHHPDHESVVKIIKQCIERQDKVLNLSNQNLRNIDDLFIEILSSLKWVTTLKLDHNELEQIPELTFSQMPQLTTLFLNHNRLTQLQPTLFNSLNNLTTLYLNNNQLTTLPETIFAQQKNLFFLFLESNPLKNLSHQIFNPLDDHAAVHVDMNLPAEFYHNFPKHVDLYTTTGHPSRRS